MGDSDAGGRGHWRGLAARAGSGASPAARRRWRP